MKIFVWICRILVGTLFIFSGLIKINDPVGFSFKLEEYFVVFHITWLSPIAILLAVLICSAEIIAGFTMILGMRSRWSTWALLLIILFFSFLTFYSAWFHKVAECGCFGDAIKLTPWQSFTKNMVLLALVLVLFFNHRYIKAIFKPVFGWIFLILISACSFSMGVYTWHNLPVFDFLPYKVGAYLPALTKVPPGQKGDEYQIMYTLRSKQTGALKTLSDKEYLRTKIYENPEWVYVSASDPILVRKGYQAPLSDFHITDDKGNDLTMDILTTKGYLVIYDEYDLSRSYLEVQPRLNEMALAAESYHVRTIGLTAVSSEDADAFSENVNPHYEFFYADETPLKSMVRANPGVVLFHSGTVVGKWNYRNLPPLSYFTALYSAEEND